jgi:hypothetical protein
MAAPAASATQKFCSANNVLSSGITKSDASKAIVQSGTLRTVTFDGFNYKTVLIVNSLLKNIPADADLAFGQKIFTFPAGVIEPVTGSVQVTSLTPTGLASVAGEVGLGSVVASGAVAVLGGTPTFEDIMEGSTIANHVAGTSLVSKKVNRPIAFGDHGSTSGVGVLDGSSTAAACFLNIASAFNQTAAENIAFSAKVVVHWRYLGSNFGVE